MNAMQQQAMDRAGETGELMLGQAATPAPTSGGRASAEADLAAIYDAFGIGVKARSPHILMVNIDNALRRSRCLSAVEHTFFMVPTEPEDDDDEPGEECLLNWGHNPEQYVATFREALQDIASRASGQGQAGAVAQVYTFDSGKVGVLWNPDRDPPEDGTKLFAAPGAAIAAREQGRAWAEAEGHERPGESADAFAEGHRRAHASREESPAASLQSLGGDAGVSELMSFYGVDSADALIAAQAEHIEKLQSKLQPAPSFAPQRVREG